MAGMNGYSIYMRCLCACLDLVARAERQHLRDQNPKIKFQAKWGKSAERRGGGGGGGVYFRGVGFRRGRVGGRGSTGSAGPS
jgi:hypothetical protein